jgi:hypothetical protein
MRSCVDGGGAAGENLRCHSVGGSAAAGWLVRETARALSRPQAPYLYDLN